MGLTWHLARAGARPPGPGLAGAKQEESALGARLSLVGAKGGALAHGAKPRKQAEASPIQFSARHGGDSWAGLALGDNELVALVLGSGSRTQDVLELSNLVLEQCAGLHGLTRAAAADLRRIPGVGSARAAQLLAAVELVTDKERKTPLPPEADPARRVFDRAWDNGLVIRAFANGVLGYAPPLCCTDEDIDGIIERTRMTLDQTLEDRDVQAAMKR